MSVNWPARQWTVKNANRTDSANCHKTSGCMTALTLLQETVVFPNSQPTLWCQSACKPFDVQKLVETWTSTATLQLWWSAHTTRQTGERSRWWVKSESSPEAEQDGGHSTAREDGQSSVSEEGATEDNRKQRKTLSHWLEDAVLHWRRVQIAWLPVQRESHNSTSVTGVKFAKCSEISSRAETEVETQALARVKVYRSVRLKCYGGYSCYNFMPSIHSESSDRREGQRQRHRETETDTDRKLERERDSWTDRQTYF